MSPNVRVFEDPRGLAEAAAKAFAEEAERNVREKRRFTVALAGGSTPKALYELLATEYRDALDWSKLHTFFSDERCVPPTTRTPTTAWLTWRCSPVCPWGACAGCAAS